jgi:hypothetical protein
MISEGLNPTGWPVAANQPSSFRPGLRFGMAPPLASAGGRLARKPTEYEYNDPILDIKVVFNIHFWFSFALSIPWVRRLSRQSLVESFRSLSFCSFWPGWLPFRIACTVDADAKPTTALDHPACHDYSKARTGVSLRHGSNSGSRRRIDSGLRTTKLSWRWLDERQIIL